MSMRLPSSDVAKRIAVMCRRRLTTPWLPKEIKQLRFLISWGYFDSLEDLSLVERFYISERKKGPQGIYRRDLYTMLNNWPGEVDKATAWSERFPVKQPPRKIIPGPFSRTEPDYVPPADPDEVKRFEAERLARKGRIL